MPAVCFDIKKMDTDSYNFIFMGGLLTSLWRKLKAIISNLLEVFQGVSEAIQAC